MASYLRDLIFPVWIGLSDNLHEGKFAWSDGVSPVLYTNWADKEPNNADGKVSYWRAIRGWSCARFSLTVPLGCAVVRADVQCVLQSSCDCYITEMLCEFYMSLHKQLMPLFIPESSWVSCIWTVFVLCCVWRRNTAPPLPIITCRRAAGTTRAVSWSEDGFAP